jgi:ribosomal protein L32
MSETTTTTKTDVVLRTFYLREFYTRWINAAPKNSKEQWVKDPEFEGSRNRPVLVIRAVDIEAAQHVATNHMRSLIADAEGRGFVRNEKGWRTGNRAVGYLWKISVEHSCRNCQGTGKWKNTDRVCFKCGGTGDEENPIDKNGKPYPAYSGVDFKKVKTVTSKLMPLAVAA